MQLSAQALLRPFNTAASNNTDDADDDCDGDRDDMPGLVPHDDEEEEEEEDEEEEENKDEDEDPLEALDDEEREALMRDTEVVKTTLNKVCLC
jgi:hypothetical protein